MSRKIKPFGNANDCDRTDRCGPRVVALLSLLVCGLCSCTTFGRVMSDGIPSGQHAEPERQPKPAQREAVQRKTATQPLGRVSLSSPTPSQVVRIRQTGYSNPIDPPPGAGSFSQGIPAATIPQWPAAPAMQAGNPIHLHPDEYLFDGGDRANPVHYDEFRRLGLDTEDTVAEFTDHLGKRHMKPTNRVAIYAPRFAEVRTIGQAETGVGSQRLIGIQKEVRVAGLRTRLATANHKGRSVPANVRVRTRGSGIDGDRTQVTFDNLTVLASHRVNRKPMENLALIRSGVFDRTQEAVLAMGMKAAVTWTKKLSPIIVGSTREAGKVSAKFELQEMIGREDMRKKKGDLRIVKVADKETAQHGEIITFTIRYDNLGDRELYHIRIIDNLTPRLEYVKDSADSDRKGKLVVEDNAEGSLVLKFELSEPLKGHTGGVVKFQVRVK